MSSFFTSASLRLGGLILVLAFAVAGQIRDYTRHVNPFIGTGGHGHTFPGATVPFGMVQLSPDTRIDNWDGSSGYHYSDNVIHGFSHTHLSGTGIPDGCDILIKPTVSRSPIVGTEGNRSGLKFSHENERAEPGFYSVRLDDGVLAEMTATTRVGLHRYTFPRGSHAWLELDLIWRDKLLESEIRLVNKNQRIEGVRKSRSWAKNQAVYFVIDFSQTITSSLTGGMIIDGEDLKDKRAFFRFPSDDLGRNSGEPILVKVAISYVSIEGARKNLEAELRHWDFDKVRADAKAAWNKELSKIEVSGGTPEQTTNFYTALYHTMIHPNVLNDVDGRYKGHDGKIHQLPDYSNRRDAETQRKPGGNATVLERANPKSKIQNPKSEEHYTVFSLWDTFRATHPLYTIIDQKRTVDFINTFIRIYEQGGRLPVWELWGEETDTMIGYHAVSVIADAMAKGIKGFDHEKAYQAAKHSAELDHFGLAAYKRRGYISMEDENESVSKTLEYAYNDWCIYQMALLLSSEPVPGDPLTRRPIPDKQKAERYEKDANEFRARSRSFENLFDTGTGFMRPKRNGGFVEPFAPNEVTFGFTEGNSWQYSFFVPHNVSRLIELMGGREKFAAKLDELFTTDQKFTGREQADLTGLIGQYAHGNEPSHHITYLYNNVGEPWKTQKYVRYIMDNFYKNAPEGLIGNEDCGQMSAWYVLSASGFYPVNPGAAYYDLGTPLFKEVKFNLENGKTFRIKAPDASARNIYVKSARLNGSTLPSLGFRHREIMNGGVLEFEMTSGPHKSPRPVRTENADLFIAVPVISGGGRVFTKQTTVTLRTTTTGAQIGYSVNGTERLYTGPFTIDTNSTVRAKAFLEKDGQWRERLAAEATFNKQLNDWIVKVISGYSTQYTGGGENAIVDGIRGTVNFASGEWQGIQGKPYEAVIDLQRPTEIKELGASFLQVAGPWIWMPDRIVFEVSNDGTNFSIAAEIKPGFDQREMAPTIKEFTQRIPAVKARYVRMRAYNIGKIPAWHPGAGGDPWIFVDEIFIR